MGMMTLKKSFISKSYVIFYPFDIISNVYHKPNVKFKKKKKINLNYLHYTYPLFSTLLSISLLESEEILFGLSNIRHI